MNRKNMSVEKLLKQKEYDWLRAIMIRVKKAIDEKNEKRVNTSLKEFSILVLTDKTTRDLFKGLIPYCEKYFYKNDEESRNKLIDYFNQYELKKITIKRRFFILKKKK